MKEINGHFRVVGFELVDPEFRSIVVTAFATTGTWCVQFDRYGVDDTPVVTIKFIILQCHNSLFFLIVNALHTSRKSDLIGYLARRSFKFGQQTQKYCTFYFYFKRLLTKYETKVLDTLHLHSHLRLCDVFIKFVQGLKCCSIDEMTLACEPQIKIII